MIDSMHSGPSRGRAILLTVGTIVAIALFIVAVVVLKSFTRTPGGVVAVVRNGGPLDNNRIRQVIQPASSRVYSGLFSTVHEYPAQQRFYTITSDSTRGDRTGVDVELDPTKDGVQVGIEGTVYFTLNTDPAVLSDFDNKYGTRTYRGQDNKVRHAYDGDDGWDSFLDQIVRPVISNDLRQQIGDSRCAGAGVLVRPGAEHLGHDGDDRHQRQHQPGRDPGRDQQVAADGPERDARRQVLRRHPVQPGQGQPADQGAGRHRPGAGGVRADHRSAGPGGLRQG